jgi:hypothetical protein
MVREVFSRAPKRPDHWRAPEVATA